MNRKSYRKLYVVISDHLNFEECEVACDRIGADFGKMASKDSIKRAKVLDMQIWAEKRGKIDILISVIHEMRPHLDLRPYGGAGPVSESLSSGSLERLPATIIGEIRTLLVELESTLRCSY